MVGSFFIKLEHGVSVFIAEPRIFAKKRAKENKKTIKTQRKKRKKDEKNSSFL